MKPLFDGEIKTGVTGEPGDCPINCGGYSFPYLSSTATAKVLVVVEIPGGIVKEFWYEIPKK